MAIRGAITALLVTGTTLDFYAQIGVVLLIRMFAALPVETVFIPGCYAIMQTARERVKG